MSEVYQPLIDGVMYPPQDGNLKYVIDLARDIQATLDHTQAMGSYDDRKPYEESLDKIWPHMNQELNVSGTCYFMERIDIHSRPTITKKIVAEQPLISMGFQLVQRSFLDDAYLADTRLLVMHLLKCPETNNNVFAHIDDVIFDFPSDGIQALEMSNTRYHYPELIANIDEILIDSDEDGVEALRGLSTVSIEYQHGSDDAESFGAIERYVNSYLDFDSEVPYKLRASIYGHIDGDEDMDLHVLEKEDTSLGFPVGVSLRQDPGLHYPAIYRFWMVFEVLPEDRLEDDPFQILIPLDKDLNLQPLRQIFYDEVDKESDE